MRTQKFVASLGVVTALVLTTIASVGWAQAVPAEKANESRIDQLLAKMTLEEKMN